MYTKSISSQGLVLLFLCMLAFIGGGCAQEEAETNPVATPTSGLRAPDGVIGARRAVLDFLRDGALICVPPAGVSWDTQPGPAPKGFEVYRFESEGCFMTVAYPLPETAESVYHIAVHNSVTGFCWQANVDKAGEVVATGSRAGMDPALAETAAAYCQAQGYSYAVKEQADGTSCGVCSLEDGRSCKAWAYYQGFCSFDDQAVTQ